MNDWLDTPEGREAVERAAQKLQWFDCAYKPRAYAPVSDYVVRAEAALREADVIPRAVAEEELVRVANNAANHAAYAARVLDAALDRYRVATGSERP